MYKHKAGKVIYSPIQVGKESFHWAKELGTVSHLIAMDPWRIYPGLHSKRTNEPTANSLPILLPNLGSGTELHCVELVLGTAAYKELLILTSYLAEKYIFQNITDFKENFTFY